MKEIKTIKTIDNLNYSLPTLLHIDHSEKQTKNEFEISKIK